MVKKVLIHSIVFSPDGVSTAYLYNDIALRFREEGYQVVVLTTTPHYNVLSSELAKQPLKRKWFGLFFVSNFKGISVLHVPQKKFKSSVLRILGFIYWHILSFFLGLSQKNINLILSPSPPLTIGIINLLLGKIKGAKVIYNVQEIYPDFLINQGKLKLKPVISLLRSMERVVYNRSDAVTTIDAVFYQTILPRFDKPEKLKIIPNFVDIDLFKPLGKSHHFLDDKIFPPKPDILKVMYAGNLGHAQDWKPLVELAKTLVSDKIEFWIIGEGVMKGFLEEQVEKYNLANVHIVPYQNRELMPSLIAYADLHFIFMSPEMDGQGFPSKVYSIMACAKPLLVISGANTPICNFLSKLRCAYLIRDRSLKVQCESISSILKNLRNNKSELEIMGRRGFDHIQKNYSKDVVTKEYISLANQLLEA